MGNVSDIRLRTTLDGRVRARTIPVRGSKPPKARYPLSVLRPKTRADCVDGLRPCPFTSCRHHLYLDVSASGGLKLNFPTKKPGQLKETCSLDVAAQGGKTLEEVGELMNLTRERVRQIEAETTSNMCSALEEWKALR